MAKTRIDKLSTSHRLCIIHLPRRANQSLILSIFISFAICKLFHSLRADKSDPASDNRFEIVYSKTNKSLFCSKTKRAAPNGRLVHSTFISFFHPPVLKWIYSPIKHSISSWESSSCSTTSFIIFIHQEQVKCIKNGEIWVCKSG